jgi:hypothetical protein
MNEALRRLVRLQDLILSAETVSEKIAAIPAEIARLEKDLLAVQEELERARAGLQEMQKDRRKLEMELMGVESRIAKYQSQLLEVKTNKEYQAMLHEIEAAKNERASLDERILLEMEDTDSRGAAVRAIEERLKDRRRATEEGKRRLDDLLEALKREKEALEGERQRLAATIPRDYLDPFLRVARQRRGVALVAVREELCGGCHVRVMPKLIQQVRRAEGLIACDSCKRFLYVPEEAAPGSGASSGTGPASGPGASSGPDAAPAGGSPAQ